MAIRLQEMHPALVRLPIALLPLAVGADLVGSMADNKSFLAFGQPESRKIGLLPSLQEISSCLMKNQTF